MTLEILALIAPVATVVVLRLLDYILPSGRRFKILDRFTTPNEEDDDETT
jgi:hypothetical protein